MVTDLRRVASVFTETHKLVYSAFLTLVTGLVSYLDKDKWNLFRTGELLDFAAYWISKSSKYIPAVALPKTVKPIEALSVALKPAPAVAPVETSIAEMPPEAPVVQARTAPMASPAAPLKSQGSIKSQQKIGPLCPRVRPLSRSRVVPVTPTKEHWLRLSNLDRVVNPTFSSVVLFYQKVVNENTTFADVTSSLKSSLAKVLVDFYPLAGRLTLREDGLVDLHCNDAGALFLEASVEIDLSSIGGPKPMPALSGLDFARLGPGPKYIPDQLSPMPTLVVMVTKFKCGSISVAANWHHTVADGSSGVHFVKSWSEVHSGKEISLLPNHDRSLIKPRSPPDASLVHGYTTQTTAESIKESEMEPAESCDVGNTAATEEEQPAFPQEEPMIDTFLLTKESILKLKQDVQSTQTETGGYFSSAESVSAYLWNVMIKSRGASPEDHFDNPDDDEHRLKMLKKSTDTTRFFMFVDGRKRLNLPSGYFGNAVCSACAVSRETDILSNPYSYAASLIRKATKSATGEYFQSLIDWVETQGCVTSSKSEHMNSVGHDVAATFWTFFPLYEIEFGWGKPELAARNSAPRPLIDGIAMMPGSAASGDMMALLNLHADRMDRLRRRRSFRSRFRMAA